MPQMAPLNWSMLYLYTSMILLLTTTLVYYMILNKPLIIKKLIKLPKMKTNWKW
uniref:ATP synthase F0 subunit 8 n=1 Tax=Scolytinae sp. BMNH 1040052 TaxID=1903778 RepID=A0A343A518_9CUCU|nr:ATP synthase F0 subunit 8 [Scolytinae sp. BMNH 1040052]